MAVAEELFNTLPQARSAGSARSSGVVSDGPAIRLSADQKAAFHRDGFLVVEKLTTREEIAQLRVLYDRLFSQRCGWENGDFFDMVARDSAERAPSLPQMLWPSRYEPHLRQTRLHASAYSIAQQLLGPEPKNILEHAIMKPAFNGAATPWHQDDAFSRRGSGFVEAISIWMPLQEVDGSSGCMQYIPGSNHGPLYPHRSPNNDPTIHGLEVVDAPTLANSVAVSLQEGAAVIHHSRTLHSAGINTGDQPRRAYILGYAVQTRRHSIFSRDYSWNLEKRTARLERSLQTLPPWKRSLRRIRRILRGG